MHPFYIVRAGGGLLFLTGMLIMAYNISKTIAQGKPAVAVIPQPAVAH
jgi:cytochrome c oxidase cbb3-type subunit 1